MSKPDPDAPYTEAEIAEIDVLVAEAARLGVVMDFSSGSPGLCDMTIDQIGICLAALRQQAA